MTSPLNNQVGGTHYKTMKIQPVEFILANDLDFCQGNIIKYTCRYKQKGGVEDLKKVIHYAQLLIDNIEKDKPHVDTDWRSDYTTGPRGDSVGQGTLLNKRVLPVCAT